MKAKIIIPTVEGFEITKQVSQRKTIGEWNSFFKKENKYPGQNLDEEVTLYKHVGTGRALVDIELVCVEPVKFQSGLGEIGYFCDYDRMKGYSQIKKIAEARNFPFVGVSHSGIVTRRGERFEEMYLVQLYRRSNRR